MLIRKAQLNDIPALIPIFQSARRHMIQTGNPNQWGEGYPPVSFLEQDIGNGDCYVVEEDSRICATFTLIFGEDPTYLVIENGQWLNDEPYGTIHRLASDGSVPGIFRAAIDFARRHTDNVRIDTHADNHVMQDLLTRAQFTYCGIIYCHNGTERLAYHWVKSGPTL